MTRPGANPGSEVGDVNALGVDGDGHGRVPTGGERDGRAGVRSDGKLVHRACAVVDPVDVRRVDRDGDRAGYGPCIRCRDERHDDPGRGAQRELLRGDYTAPEVDPVRVGAVRVDG